MEKTKTLLRNKRNREKEIKCPLCGLSLYAYTIQGQSVLRCCGHPYCDYQIISDEIQQKARRANFNQSQQVDRYQYGCPTCGMGGLSKKRGKKGVFWGCSRYPSCRYTCNDYQGEPSSINIYDYDN